MTINVSGSARASKQVLDVMNAVVLDCYHIDSSLAPENVTEEVGTLFTALEYLDGSCVSTVSSLVYPIMREHMGIVLDLAVCCCVPSQHTRWARQEKERRVTALTLSCVQQVTG